MITKVIVSSDGRRKGKSRPRRVRVPGESVVRIWESLSIPYTRGLGDKEEKNLSMIAEENDFFLRETRSFTYRGE